MNFTKSRWGGFGINPAHEHSVSSSVPNPLYGGICLGQSVFGFGRALFSN